jgi:hypothetical protein
LATNIILPGKKYEKKITVSVRAHNPGDQFPLLFILQILQSCQKSGEIVRHCTHNGHDFKIFMIDMLMDGYNLLLFILQILQSCQKSREIVRHCTRNG